MSSLTIGDAKEPPKDEKSTACKLCLEYALARVAGVPLVDARLSQSRAGSFV